MKKLLIFAALAAIASGCSSTYVKTPEWEAKVTSHLFKRDVDKLAVSRLADGSYSVDLNGYKGDASEQLPAFTKEMWTGLGILGRIAGAAVNPAVASVPLVPEQAANADDVAKLVKANAELKAQVTKAKAALVEAKAEAKATAAKSTATTGTTTNADCPDCEIIQ